MDTDARDPVSPNDTDRTAALEGTARGRLAVSAFVVVTLVAILAVTMPDSAIKGHLLTVTRPFLLATGLDQRWGVFAPNPRLETSYVAVRVERADGTVSVVDLPHDGGISEYWNYRWRKYGEQLWTGKENERERLAFSRWVIDRERAAGRTPVRVTLLRHTAANLAPGAGPDQGPWRDVPFFTTTVRTP